MYRLIKLISLVILIMMPSTDSYADEVLWGTLSDTSGKSVWNASANGISVNTGTNQVPAIQEVLTAICSNGGGTLNFDQPGIISIGSTGPNVFYSGIQVTCSNVRLTSSPGFGVVFRPLFTNGGSLLNVCPSFNNSPTYGANKTCTVGSVLENIVIENLSFYDNDPAGHCASYRPALGVCSIGGTVAGKGEETHAIFIGYTKNSLIRNNKVDSMGDEGIVVQCDDCTVDGNFIYNTPSIRGSGGSSIEITGNNVTISNNFIDNIQADPLGDGSACIAPPCQNNGAAISVATNTLVDIRRINILNNKLSRIDSTSAIGMQSNGASVRDVTVSGNIVGMLNQNGLGCPSNIYYNPEDPGPGGGVPPLTVTNARCSFRSGGTDRGQSGWTFDGIKITDNTLNAAMTIIASGESKLGSMNISNNVIGGEGQNIAGAVVPMNGMGMNVAGFPLTISNNTVLNFSENALFLAGANTDRAILPGGVGAVGGTGQVSITGNSFINNNSDSTAEEGIEMFPTATDPCGVDGVVEGGVSLSGNMFMANESGAITYMVNMPSCARYSSTGDYFDGSGVVVTGGLGAPARVTGTTLINPGSYGINTNSAGVSITGNVISGSGNRSIYGPSADDMTVVGNTIIDPGFHAADISGQRPVCVGNKSRNTTFSADRVFFCGATTGAGCGVDVAAGGICDLNSVCNNADAGC